MACHVHWNVMRVAQQSSSDRPRQRLPESVLPEGFIQNEDHWHITARAVAPSQVHAAGWARAAGPVRISGFSAARIGCQAQQLSTRLVCRVTVGVEGVTSLETSKRSACTL